MKEHYCTYEQSVALKRLGFDWECDHSYLDKTIDKSGNPYLYHVEVRNWNNFDHEVECYSAPRLDQAQKWLREVKGIIVWISPEFYEGDALEDVKWYFYTQHLQNLRKQRGGKVEGRYYDSYESALSAGLDAALELLGKEVNND